MSQSEEDASFFERERDKLSRDITLGFEELLSTSNVLNRKLEEVLGMTREYETIAALWRSFYDLMSGGTSDVGDATEEHGPGFPGTGGHLVKQALQNNGTEAVQRK